MVGLLFEKLVHLLFYSEDTLLLLRFFRLELLLFSGSVK